MNKAAFKIKASIKGTWQEINGVVVDHDEDSDAMGLPIYYPIYEYAINGKVQRYTGETPTTEKEWGGETLYYEKSTGKTFDCSDAWNDGMMSLLCGFVGVAMIYVAFF